MEKVLGCESGEWGFIQLYQVFSVVKFLNFSVSLVPL